MKGEPVKCQAGQALHWHEWLGTDLLWAALPPSDGLMVAVLDAETFDDHSWPEEFWELSLGQS